MKLIFEMNSFIPLPVEKKEVWGLEKCALKLAKSGCSLLFNGACLRKHMIQNGLDAETYRKVSDFADIFGSELIIIRRRR